MKEVGAPTLSEDLLLVLFQPGIGAIAGEEGLHFMLAGAVLAELVLDECVTITVTETGSAGVKAVEGRAPTDGILRLAWDHATDKPGVVQLLTAIGPELRQPLLERLIARGDLREENGKVLGLLKKTTLKDGGNGRRSGLIKDVRNLLVEGGASTPRVTALAALMWGSGTLRRFDPEIPWSPVVVTRAKQLVNGDWCAQDNAPGLATTRAAAAMIVIVAACVPPREDAGP